MRRAAERIRVYAGERTARRVYYCDLGHAHRTRDAKERCENPKVSSRRTARGEYRSALD